MQSVAKKKTMSTPLPGAGILGVNLYLIEATLFLLCCFVMYRRKNNVFLTSPLAGEVVWRTTSEQTDEGYIVKLFPCSVILFFLPLTRPPATLSRKGRGERERCGEHLPQGAREKREVRRVPPARGVRLYRR